MPRPSFRPLARGRGHRAGPRRCRYAQRDHWRRSRDAVLHRLLRHPRVLVRDLGLPRLPRLPKRLAVGWLLPRMCVLPACVPPGHCPPRARVYCVCNVSCSHTSPPAPHHWIIGTFSRFATHHRAGGLPQPERVRRVQARAQRRVPCQTVMRQLEHGA
jgi:hypothetical protein